MTEIEKFIRVKNTGIRIELDKTKELRKEIYKLQNSRKKQPKMFVFRTPMASKDNEIQLHIFDGWSITDEKKGQFCADYWRKATKKQAEIFNEKYGAVLKPEYKPVLDKIIKEGE